VLCTATDWRVVKYTPAGGPSGQQPASVKQTVLPLRLTLHTSVEEVVEDLRPLVLALAGVLVEQMASMDKVILEHPNITQAGIHSRGACQGESCCLVSCGGLGGRLLCAVVCCVSVQCWCLC
jgi:hypothetical protein